MPRQYSDPARHQSPFQKELEAIANPRKPMYPRSGIVHIRVPRNAQRSLCGLTHYTEYPVRFQRKGRVATCKSCLKKAGPSRAAPPEPKSRPTIWERLQSEGD